MKKLYLPAEEKDYLEREHALKENGKERDRIKAILLRSEGWTVPQSYCQIWCMPKMSSGGLPV